MKERRQRAFGACAWVLAALLAACGGGGGGGGSGGSAGTAPLLPTLSEDVAPAGARTDVSARNLFPLAVGDTWTYDRRSGSTGAVTGTVTRSVAAGPDANGYLRLREVDGADVVDTLYRRVAAGLEMRDPFGAEGFLPGVYQALPSYIEYPTPLYPVGGLRRSLRQGSLGVDIDGDGQVDYYSAELRQIFRGFETIAVLGQPTEVAHFSITLSFLAVGTRTRVSYTVTATEETYFASGIGLVRAERAATGSDGAIVTPAYAIELRSATIGGQVVNGTDGNSMIVRMTHADLVYDPLRAVYYASVPSSVIDGNRIARIDAQSGAVSYSAPVGSNPGALALSADGSVLYVGLGGSGEIVSLELPNLQELARVRLPMDPFFGQLFAEDISVSPASRDVFAVSTRRSGVSPRHGGVFLVRDMVVQPRRTQDHTGSNRIGFDATGSQIYGYNNETTEFGLRRIEVLADGLREAAVVAANGGFGTMLDVRDGLALVGPSAFAADASLAPLGSVSGAWDCSKLPGRPRVACLSSTEANRLVVADTLSFALLGTPRYVDVSGSLFAPRRVVPGAARRVAISEGDRIVLFESDLLQ